MTSFEDFVRDLDALLTLINKQTGKVFLPIAVSHSPVKPAEQFIVVLRTSENVQGLPLQGWFTDVIPQLAKKFVTKKIKLDAKLNVGTFAIKLTQQLRLFYQQEGLNVIGGFQDSANQLNLLFFKLDRLPTTTLPI